MGEEVFFDCLDSDSMSSDYDVWLKEPHSIKERRNVFLSTMGFVESAIEKVTDDCLLSERQKSNSEANCSIDYSDQYWLDDISMDMTNANPVPAQQCERRKNERKLIKWWRHFTQRRNNNEDKSRMRMEQNRKKILECSAVFAGTQVKAHNGLIRTMKFSPDGQYLASGGQDGVVCIWRVSMVDAACEAECGSDMDNKFNAPNKKWGHSSIIVPEKIFHVEEEPVNKLNGHSSDVLDLAWSTSNYLLSSSMDQTVRLWKPGSDECLGLFHHSNYVTCVQFNPANENYFISGSIDGKVRIWGISKRRVVEWINAKDIITAVCYSPSGKGFVVGSVSGICSFYESSSDELVLNAQVNIHGRKKSSGCRVTAIQFLRNDNQIVMVTSEDSKICILNGLEVIRKYRGLTRSGSQMSASFTSSGRHIVSIGDDSRIYLWNHDNLCVPASSKHTKSIRTCEYISLEGVSVVIPWFGSEMEQDGVVSNNHRHQEPSSRLRDSERFSLVNWFNKDSSSRACTTWPEEKLTLWDFASEGYEQQARIACGNHFHQNG